MPTICIFGDSTAWGAWDTEMGGWVNRLWLDRAKEDKETFIYNLSIPGGTTETILARFESEAKIREADAIVFQTGGNDSAYDKDNGQHLVPIEKFKDNLEKIIEKAKTITDKIAFMGFKNCDESKTMPVAWCNLCYTNESIQKYNEVMRTVCDKNGIPFIDTFGLLDDSDFVDGLHPNAKGHQKIFQAVWKAILSL